MLMKDKVAVVTGGSTGIGRASAILLAKEGAKVVIADINDAEAASAVDAIRSAGGTADYVHTDVSSDASVAALFAKVKELHGQFDVLANVAGAQRAGYIGDLKESDWDLLHNVNSKSMWLTAKHGVPLMRKGGSIINVASLAALKGGGGMTAYSSSKGAVFAFSRALAIEVAPNIRVNCLCPGWTDTPFNDPAIGLMWGGDKKAQNQTVKETIPLQRQAVPEEQAQALLFLASDMSSFMTNQTLVIDGGAL
jgi:NAD(P)-dependent dehydrogenase (short-subunit alcohol dehydrogenase family)